MCNITFCRSACLSHIRRYVIHPSVCVCVFVWVCVCVCVCARVCVCIYIYTHTHTRAHTHTHTHIRTYIYTQDVSGGILNILGGGSMDYSEEIS